MTRHDPKAVGGRIRTRREQLDMGQRALAFTGCSHAYLSRLEAGQRQASAHVLEELARRLGTTRRYLETGEPDPVELGLEAGGIKPGELTDEERELLEHDLEQATFRAARGVGIAIRLQRNEAKRAALEAERQGLLG